MRLEDGCRSTSTSLQIELSSAATNNISTAGQPALIILHRKHVEPPDQGVKAPAHLRRSCCLVPISEVGNFIQSRHHDYFFFRPDKGVCAVFQLPDLMHSAIAWLQSGMQPVRSGLPLQYATHLPFSCEQLFPVICAQLGVATNPRAIIQLATTIFMAVLHDRTITSIPY